MSSLTVFGVKEQRRNPQKIWAKLGVWAEAARSRKPRQPFSEMALAVMSLVALALLVFLSIGWRSRNRTT